jgi:hypothetical protein
MSHGFDEKSETVYYPTPKYKMMDYQILVFENYDKFSSEIVPANEAVDAFIEISHKYLLLEEAEFDTDGERMVRFTDTSDGDKQMMVLMTGVFTPEMISAIQDSHERYTTLVCWGKRDDNYEY